LVFQSVYACVWSDTFSALRCSNLRDCKCRQRQGC
jgi:hypothetical protein